VTFTTCSHLGKCKPIPLKTWTGPEGSRNVVRLSALRTGRLYPPRNIPGTHFCQRLSQPHGHSMAGRIKSMKISNDTIGTRIRNRPTCRLRLKCDGICAETRFRPSAKRTSPFKSAGASVQSTTGSRGVRISGSNAGYTMFRGSVKSTGYPLHSSVSPSLPLPSSPYAITFQQDSIAVPQPTPPHVPQYSTALNPKCTKRAEHGVMTSSLLF
jgi:hypothetical protein